MKKPNFNEIKEYIKLMVYHQEVWVNRILRVFYLLFSLLVLYSIIDYHGMARTEDSEDFFFTVTSAAFTYFILSFFVKAFYTLRFWDFLKENLTETLLTLCLIVEGTFYNLTGDLLFLRFLELLGIHAEVLSGFTALAIQVYFLVIILHKALRTSRMVPYFRLHPAALFLLAFVALIFSGAALLMLPEMTAQGRPGLSFVDALFMSTSASCVTGLSTINVATALSFKGKFVLLLLMKIGGINIVAFGSFILLMAKLGVGVKQHPVIEDIMLRDNLASSRGILPKVFLWGTLVELTGTVLLYFLQDPVLYRDTEHRIFNAWFHAVSAFNNAGLSIFDGGFYATSIRTNYSFQLVIALLIFLGSLSFVALFDIFSLRNIKERMDKPWKGLAFQSKIALYFSIFLVIIGFAVFFSVEYDRSLKSHSFVGKMVVSLFQSITARTAGFNTVDFASLHVSTLLFFLFLMLIGASSGSTGGGMKTSTFALLGASVASAIRGRNHVILFKRTLPADLIYRAFSTFFFFIVCIFTLAFCLSLSENRLVDIGQIQFLDLLFETFSAFNTVGLSTGITNSLSTTGQCILIFAMFLGRTGTILIAFMLVNDATQNKFMYPKAHTMIG